MQRVWIAVLVTVVVVGLVVGVVLFADGGDEVADGGSPSPEGTVDEPTDDPDEDDDTEPEEEPDPVPEAMAVEEVVSGLDGPTYAISPPGDERIFVLERQGRIRVVADGSLLDAPFLDVSGRVTSEGLEQGLLGLAFHPDFADNGRLFVHYSAAGGGDTVVEEYRVTDGGDEADPASARTILTRAQPAANHNGGMVTFGPDGFLWLALGDGGGAGDQFGNGQDPSTLLGTIVRIDVDAEEDGRPYAIADGNPFADGDDGAPEVWAYGLRNPWRFTLDEGLLYIADVGQNEREWVNVVPDDEPGLNHGWPITEGSQCFDPPEGCDRDGLVTPVLEYANAGGECGIVGGFVYRGGAIPGLHGHYFYSDYCAGWVRSFRYDPDAGATDEQDWSEDIGTLGRVFSFGLDGAGELLVLTEDGRVLRLVPA